MTQLIHKELTYTVRGILFKVHNQLGPKLPEKFYQKAITLGLERQGIICEPEKPFEVIYRNQSAGKYYVDLWIENGKLILELKVKPKILPIHQAQTISYLKLTNADLAIIANFGTKSLQDQRLPNFIRNKVAKFEWQPPPLNKNLVYPELTERILESLHRVHFTLGPGFIHRVYRESVMIDLQLQSINYNLINEIPYYFDDDYIDTLETQMIKVENKILLGVFALEFVDDTMVEVMTTRMEHLKTTVGFLANFYGERLQVERIYSTPYSSAASTPSTPSTSSTAD